MGGKIVLLDLDEPEAKCYIKICVPQEACEHTSFVEMYYIYFIYRLGLALHLDSSGTAVRIRKVKHDDRSDSRHCLMQTWEAGSKRNQRRKMRLSINAQQQTVQPYSCWKEFDVSVSALPNELPTSICHHLYYLKWPLLTQGIFMYWPSWALESSSPGQFIPHWMIMKGNRIITGFLLSRGGKNVVVGISPSQEWLLITEQGIWIIWFSVYK